MRRPLRIALVVVGLAAVVYGTASLTGGWLGTPPWWEVWIPAGWASGGTVREGDPPSPPHPGVRLVRFSWDEPFAEALVGRHDRDWISGGVVAVGLGFVAVGALPHRRRPAPS